MTASARLAIRQIRRGWLIVLVLVSALSAIVVVQYRYTFTDPAQVASLGVLAPNPAIRVLFGVPLALDSAGGLRSGVPAPLLPSRLPAGVCW
jgi:ABC-2 type transport system permease protein